MLDKKQIWVIFKFKFRIGHNAAETTHNINNEFVSGTANKCTVQWWFKKFCKRDESLKYECSGQPLEGDNNQLRAVIEADPHTTTQEVTIGHSMVIQHLK